MVIYLKDEPVKVTNGEIVPDFDPSKYSFQKKLDAYQSIEKNYFPLKRMFDLIMAIALLYITFPIIIIFAFLISIESFGNPFYKQVRVGKMGRPIKIYKLRSMHNNAEKHGIQWAQKDDPRVTRIGKFIRKTKIDELPQLLNVVKGEMSFIGPRPERPEFVELFSSEINGFEKRCLVTPGLSGLAQVQGGYELSPAEKLEYDIKYIKKCSIFMEFTIILKTIIILFTGTGSR